LRRRCGCCFGWRGCGLRGARYQRVDVLVSAADDCEQRSHLRRVALVCDPFLQDPIATGNQLHHCLVCLDLSEDVAAFYGVAFVLEPFDKTALLHRRGESLHHNLGRHSL
jgi:hypothetical protein